jgi:hypothetical protein
MYAPTFDRAPDPPGQLLGERRMLVPVRGWPLRIKPRILVSRLVPVENNRRALKRHTPGMAVDLTVLQERRIEAAQPGAVRVAGRQRIERHDQVIVDERECIGGEQDSELWTGIRLQSGLCLGQRVLIRTCIDRRYLDRRVVTLEVGGIAVNDLGDRSTDRYREIEADLGRFGSTRNSGKSQRGDGLQQTAT